MNRKVLIAAPVHTILLEGLKAEDYEPVIEKNITQNSAHSLIKDCIGVITSTRLQLDKDLIDAAPDLKWIGRMGSGMEVIDVPYAQSKNIVCFSSPQGNCNAVAEHALGMLLSLTKKISWSHQEVKEGKWIRDANRGMELDGKTIGIIGFGHTGKAFAKKLRGFDLRILVYDKYKQDATHEHIIFCKDLAPIFNEADIVSFHVPLQEDTFHYFNDDFLSKIKKPVILINTSRGKVINTKTVEAGLKNKKIAGVCLDVLEEEPFENMDDEMRKKIQAILSLPNVVITPHIAGYSEEAMYKMSEILLKQIVMVS